MKRYFNAVPLFCVIFSIIFFVWAWYGTITRQCVGFPAPIKCNNFINILSVAFAFCAFSMIWFLDDLYKYLKVNHPEKAKKFLNIIWIFGVIIFLVWGIFTVPNGAYESGIKPKAVKDFCEQYNMKSFYHRSYGGYCIEEPTAFRLKITDTRNLPWDGEKPIVSFYVCEKDADKIKVGG